MFAPISGKSQELRTNLQVSLSAVSALGQRDPTWAGQGWCHSSGAAHSEPQEFGLCQGGQTLPMDRLTPLISWVCDPHHPWVMDFILI